MCFSIYEIISFIFIPSTILIKHSIAYIIKYPTMLRVLIFRKRRKIISYYFNIYCNNFLFITIVTNSLFLRIDKVQ